MNQNTNGNEHLHHRFPIHAENVPLNNVHIRRNNPEWWHHSLECVQLQDYFYWKTEKHVTLNFVLNQQKAQKRLTINNRLCWCIEKSPSCSCWCIEESTYICGHNIIRQIHNLFKS